MVAVTGAWNMGKYMDDRTTYLLACKLSDNFESSEKPTIIAIGDVDQWRQNFGGKQGHKDLHFSDLASICAETLHMIKPDLVVSPVVTPSFDCIDVGALLASSGFRGSYRALSANLPNPSIIRREVRNYFPRLDFDICEIHGSGVRIM